MNPSETAKQILGGSIQGLAKAITLVESSRPDHREQADKLLKEVLPKTGHSIRIGVSGSPGVGKSTFIEVFGLFLIAKGIRVAVLAVDPSSPVHGGSILGDKTRMNELACSPHAFIRPSPSGGTLGGVNRRTREAMLLCEAAGFDVLIIETVGVGQSEVTVASMVDVFIPLHMPSSGDELQGVKKGVMELADLVVITKADGDLKSRAELSQLEIKRAFSLVRSDEQHQIPDTILVSSTEKAGIETVWTSIQAFVNGRKKSGLFERRRQKQLLDWFDQEISTELMHHLSSRSNYQAVYMEIKASVASLQRSASAAARELVRRLTS